MEIDYETQIEPFPAHDLYVDGSLYLLDTPGHWPGHMCALARTTPDTFILLEGTSAILLATFAQVKMSRSPIRFLKVHLEIAEMIT